MPDESEMLSYIEFTDTAGNVELGSLSLDELTSQARYYDESPPIAHRIRAIARSSNRSSVGGLLATYGALHSDLHRAVRSMLKGSIGSDHGSMTFTWDPERAQLQRLFSHSLSSAMDVWRRN